MNKNISLVVLIAGIIVALLVGVGTYTWLQKKTAVQPQVVATQPVVVAAVDVSWGTVLGPEQLKTVEFLKTSLPQGYFSKPSDVAGRTLIYPVRAGAPLFESQLAPTSVKIGGVSAIISKNKRAMAFRVDKIIGVSGFIYPGHHVDVLVTIEGITKTVLENVLVLTVGQEVDNTKQQETTGNQEVIGKQETTDKKETTSKKNKPVMVDVITMEVSSEDAEKLAMAASSGKVMLALRNPADTDPVVTKGVTVPKLLASLTGPVTKTAGVTKPVIVYRSEPRKAATMEKATKPFVVQGIRGGAVSEYRFDKEGE